MLSARSPKLSVAQSTIAVNPVAQIIVARLSLLDYRCSIIQGGNMTRKFSALFYACVTYLVLSGLLGTVERANAQTQIQIYPRERKTPQFRAGI